MSIMAEIETAQKKRKYTKPVLSTGRRRELAEMSEAIFGRYRFIPKRKRGRQKNKGENGRPRGVDAGVLLKLEQAFSYGCTIGEALSHADITWQAWYSFIELNPDYKTRVEQLRQHPLVVARVSVTKGMKKSGELALKYLERKLPDEFSLKAVVNHNFEFNAITLDKPKVIEAITESLPEVEDVNDAG